MSIASEITRLQNAKSALKTSINAKLNSNQAKITSEHIDEYSTFVDNISQGITPSGAINITQNGTYDVKNYEYANVNVSVSGTPNEVDVILAGSYGVLTEEVCTAIINGTYVYQS